MGFCAGCKADAFSNQVAILLASLGKNLRTTRTLSDFNRQATRIRNFIQFVEARLEAFGDDRARAEDSIWPALRKFSDELNKVAGDAHRAGILNDDERLALGALEIGLILVASLSSHYAVK
jgi:hypothetical protein